MHACRWSLPSPHLALPGLSSTHWGFWVIYGVISENRYHGQRELHKCSRLNKLSCRGASPVDQLVSVSAVCIKEYNLSTTTQLLVAQSLQGKKKRFACSNEGTLFRVFHGITERIDGDCGDSVWVPIVIFAVPRPVRHHGETYGLWGLTICWGRRRSSSVMRQQKNWIKNNGWEWVCRFLCGFPGWCEMVECYPYSVYGDSVHLLVLCACPTLSIGKILIVGEGKTWRFLKILGTGSNLLHESVIDIRTSVLNDLY